MKKYSVQGLNATGTANKTCVTTVCGTTFRALWSEFIVGCRTNPNATDQQVEFAVGSWDTSAGTAGSAPTPKPLDVQDPIAAQTTAGIAHSGEPTYNATYHIDTDMNQRGLFRWIAEIGFEFAFTAAATKGLGGKLVAVTATSVLSMPVHFKE